MITSFIDFVSCIAFGFLVLGLPWPECAAQAPPSIGAVVLAVSEPDDPLRVVEFRPRPQYLKGPYTIVRNFSNKPIAGFRLSAAMSAPAECLSEAGTSTESEATESYGRYSDRGFEHTRVPVGSSVRVYWNLLGPSGLVWSAKALKSAYAQFQVWVSEVEFQDGTLWKRSDEDGAALAVSEKRKAAPKDCQPWKEMNDAFAEVTEVQYRHDAAPDYHLSAPSDESVGFVSPVASSDMTPSARSAVRKKNAERQY